MAAKIILLFLISVHIDQLSAITGGFYADNGVDQTVFYPKFSKKERREMQQEILTLLGLDHRPKPHSHETETSAPRYMLDLYKYILSHDTGEVFSNISSNDVQLWHDDNNLHAINDADIIMSFINHGKRKHSKTCRRLHPKKFLSMRGQSSINWASCKTRNATNSNSAHKQKHLRHSRSRRFWFDVSEVSVGEILLGAELRIYKEAGENIPYQDGLSTPNLYTISLYEIIQSNDAKDSEYMLIDVINTTKEYEGWLYFNVSRPASKWMIFPESNYGLFIKIHMAGKEEEIHPKEIHLIGTKGREDQQPFMIAFFKTSEELHVRRTRAARRQRTDTSYNDADVAWNTFPAHDDLERQEKRSCQKRTLYVSFKELGWQDWIIAPDGYAAFYCSGECSFPLNAHMNATNHAIVQTLVHLMTPTLVPKPCCSATKLSSISVLYFDDNSNVILKKYRNMVVKSCGCH